MIGTPEPAEAPAKLDVGIKALVARSGVVSKDSLAKGRDLNVWDLNLIAPLSQDRNNPFSKQECYTTH